MKIKYLAHSSFLVTSEGGVKIITDPYTAGGGIKHGAIKEAADIVTVSHEHGDHNNVKDIKGNPGVVKNSADVKGVKIKAVPAAHDEEGGAKRGKNMIFCMDVDGVTVCHLGDLGHILTAEQVKEIGKTDVLMIPVGGYFTIDGAAATKVCGQLKPAVILPMHYKTDKLDFPISGVQDFLKGKNNVTRSDDSEIEIKKEKLPAAPEIVVLKQAL